MTKAYFIILSVLIFIGALFLRVYKLDQVPASLNWDEVAAGYNAFTIANWSKDEYGNKFPVVFTSFKDDKHPVHIYITAGFVKLFGLSDFVVRLPSAILGAITVLLLILLGEIFFKSKVAGLFAGLFLALSPYHLQFSRGLWESNFALFFYILALVLFYFGLSKRKWLLPLSFLSFGISFYAYHSSKILVPPTILLLIVLEFKRFTSSKSHLIASLLVILFFVIFTTINPRILGLARISQTKFSDDQIKQTSIYKKTANKLFGEGEIVLVNYTKYFEINYLFKYGDQSPRNSVKTFGEFYIIEGLLLIPGFFALIKYRSKKLLILFCWFFLAPLPGAASATDVNANRAIFMLGPIQLVAGAGIALLLDLIRKTWLKVIVIVIVLIVLSTEFTKYITYYYQVYRVKDAIEWQYGMKDSVLFAQKHPEFNTIYVDKIRQQPYIFFLFYLKEPLPDLLKTVKYDQTEANSYNTVSSFGRYNFGNWYTVDSIPSPDILYILTPSYHSGLRYLSSFTTQKLIKYPNGSDAFYLVSGGNDYE